MAAKFKKRRETESEDRDVPVALRSERGRTAAHLTSEVIDALTRLQNGYLHVLGGLFGVDGLLLRRDKERAEGDNHRRCIFIWRRKTTRSEKGWKISSVAPQLSLQYMCLII